MYNKFLPPFKNIPPNISCVYRLNFNDGHNYIGSTIELRSRITQHLSVIRRKSDYAANIPGTGKLISVEVILEVQDRDVLLDYESYCIYTQRADPLNLNVRNKLNVRGYAMAESQLSIQIVDLLSDGLTAKEVSEVVNLTKKQVETIIFELRQLDGSFTVAQLVANYLRRKLIK